MPHRKLQPLLDAIERERNAPSEQHKLFIKLLAEMYAFEHEKGDAPSVDDFILWTAAVERRRSLAKNAAVVQNNAPP